MATPDFWQRFEIEQQALADRMKAELRRTRSRVDLAKLHTRQDRVDLALLKAKPITLDKLVHAGALAKADLPRPAPAARGLGEGHEAATLIKSLHRGGGAPMAMPAELAKAWRRGTVGGGA